MRRALPLLAMLAGPAAADLSLEEATSGLELQTCDQSELLCTTLTLPLDPRANDPEKTIDITFALSFASIESRGILFYVVGGPGGSGLASADGYLQAFDPSLTEYMDIVFVDQRGTGPDHGLICPVAQATFDMAPLTLADADGVLAAARSYVSACIAELDADDLLPVVTSDFAIGDFEAFRRMIGAPKVWLYGESYGTQVVQAYATTYPEAVRGVIVDGVVDLNLSAEGFYRSYTLAAERILSATLEACATIPDCAEDMGGDAAAVYDALARALIEAPAKVPVTLADGSQTDRELTIAHLDANAFYALYSAEGRAEFLRVLAAAGRGDLQPMLQLGYSNLSIDPETMEGIEDPGWFGAAYYAITCSDYGSGEGAPEDRARRIIEEARAFAPEAPRLLRSYYVERVACALWPHQGPDTRPEPFAGGDYPTLVLNGTGDPITPMPMAYSVLDNARNSYGVFMRGGPHVIWGRGYTCPDTIVQALLYDGTLPVDREQLCEQDFVIDYVPLTLTDPAEAADPFTFARAVRTELFGFLPLGNWDGDTPATFGCPKGGSITLSATDTGTHYDFAACRFWPDLAVTGTGEEVVMDDAGDGLFLKLSVEGSQTGQIDFRASDWDESYALSGTWNGKPAALPRSWP